MLDERGRLNGIDAAATDQAKIKSIWQICRTSRYNEGTWDMMDELMRYEFRAKIKHALGWIELATSESAKGEGPGG